MTSQEILPENERLNQLNLIVRSPVNLDYCVKYHQALEASESKVKELEEQNKEWEQSFDLYHKACRRGELEYRKIHPDYPELSRPDTGKMVSNLCDKILEQQKEIERLNGLIAKSFFNGSDFIYNKERRDLQWEQFKKDNNISQ